MVYIAPVPSRLCDDNFTDTSLWPTYPNTNSHTSSRINTHTHTHTPARHLSLIEIRHGLYRLRSIQDLVLQFIIRETGQHHPTYPRLVAPRAVCRWRRHQCRGFHNPKPVAAFVPLVAERAKYPQETRARRRDFVGGCIRSELQGSLREEDGTIFRGGHSPHCLECDDGSSWSGSAAK